MHHALAEKTASPPLPSREDGRRDDELRELTLAEAKQLAEQTAHELLGVSADEAFAMLDRGELRGQAAEPSLRALRWLIRT